MKQRKERRQEKVLKHFNDAFNHSAGYRKVQRDDKELNIAATIKKKFKALTTDFNHNESQGCSFYAASKTVRLAR